MRSCMDFCIQLFSTALSLPLNSIQFKNATNLTNKRIARNMEQTYLMRLTHEVSRQNALISPFKQNNRNSICFSLSWSDLLGVAMGRQNKPINKFIAEKGVDDGEKVKKSHRIECLTLIFSSVNGRKLFAQYSSENDIDRLLTFYEELIDRIKR